MDEHDARSVKTTVKKGVATDDVSLSNEMVTVLFGFTSPDMRRAATDHAADASCPYPHLADDMGRCPVLGGYVARDRSEMTLRDRAVRRAADIAERHDAARSDQAKANADFPRRYVR